MPLDCDRCRQSIKEKRERQQERIIKARRIEAKKIEKRHEEKKLDDNASLLPSRVIVSMQGEEEKKEKLVQYSCYPRFSYMR